MGTPNRQQGLSESWLITMYNHVILYTSNHFSFLGSYQLVVKSPKVDNFVLGDWTMGPSGLTPGSWACGSRTRALTGDARLPSLGGHEAGVKMPQKLSLEVGNPPPTAAGGVAGSILGPDPYPSQSGISRRNCGQHNKFWI